MKKGYIFYGILGTLLGQLIAYCIEDHDYEQDSEAHYTSEIYTGYENPVIREPKVYDYRLTIDNAEELFRTSNIQRRWRNEPSLQMTFSQIRALNGVYEWQSSIYFHSQREMFEYICEHFKEMKKFKVSSAHVLQKPVKSPKYHSIYDEYQDRFDDYLDDPEDETEFDPDVFYFLDD